METTHNELPQKAWTKPELIVLVRSNAEEAVLTSCKYFPTGTGDFNYNSACYENMGACMRCDAMGAS